MTGPDNDAGIDVEDAVYELRTEISRATGKLADRILGYQPGWLLDPDGADRATKIRDWHLTRAQLSARAGLDVTGEVINARVHGATWAQIGQSCGLSGEDAAVRWHTLTDRFADRYPHLVPATYRAHTHRSENTTPARGGITRTR